MLAAVAASAMSCRGRRVRTYDDERVRLAVDRMVLSAYACPPHPTLEDRELLLARDVSDTQIVDLAGRRLSWVSDVLIVEGSDGRLDLAAVDVAAGSLLRRMGIRRLGDRIEALIVDWGRAQSDLPSWPPGSARHRDDGDTPARRSTPSRHLERQRTSAPTRPEL